MISEPHGKITEQNIFGLMEYTHLLRNSLRKDPHKEPHQIWKVQASLSFECIVTPPICSGFVVKE